MEIITNNQIIHLIASEGKVFKRIEDGVIMGKEIYLGNTYYLDDEELETPVAEVANDYEEVDEISVEVKQETSEQIRLLNLILSILNSDNYQIIDCGEYK